MGKNLFQILFRKAFYKFARTYIHFMKYIQYKIFEHITIVKTLEVKS